MPAHLRGSTSQNSPQVQPGPRSHTREGPPQRVRNDTQVAVACVRVARKDNLEASAEQSCRQSSGSKFKSSSNLSCQVVSTEPISQWQPTLSHPNTTPRVCRMRLPPAMRQCQAALSLSQKYESEEARSGSLHKVLKVLLRRDSESIHCIRPPSSPALSLAAH